MRPSLFLTLLLACASCAGVQASDTSLPVYEPSAELSGSLSSIGSDTLASLMTIWAESFERLHPRVNVQVQAPGSSTAPIALIESTASLGPMSRPMKRRELEAFERRFGYPPTAVPIAVDALALFVHIDNPLKEISIPQVDRLFSATRICAGGSEISRWGQLGLTGRWEKMGFQLFGRNAASGSYGYFKQVALCGGDFRADLNEQPGSASVVQAISTSRNGIGYSGLGYRSAGVRPLALAAKVGGVPVAPTVENVGDGSYPLSRLMYMYINRPPSGAMQPLLREFLSWSLSQAGQAAVIRGGYIPLPVSEVQRARKDLDL